MYGLTDENASDIERVQKAAVRVIMGKDYIDYPHALNELNITDLYQRREKLSKNLALKIIKNPKVKHMVPLRTEFREDTRRHTETYKTHRANTQRLKTSTIPYMQNQLNQHIKKETKWCKIED